MTIESNSQQNSTLHSYPHSSSSFSTLAGRRYTSTDRVSTNEDVKTQNIARTRLPNERPPTSSSISTYSEKAPNLANSPDNQPSPASGHTWIPSKTLSSIGSKILNVIARIFAAISSLNLWSSKEKPTPSSSTENPLHKVDLAETIAAHSGNLNVDLQPRDSDDESIDGKSFIQRPSRDSDDESIDGESFIQRLSRDSDDESTPRESVDSNEYYSIRSSSTEEGRFTHRESVDSDDEFYSPRGSSISENPLQDEYSEKIDKTRPSSPDTVTTFDETFNSSPHVPSQNIPSSTVSAAPPSKPEEPSKKLENLIGNKAAFDLLMGFIGKTPLKACIQNSNHSVQSDLVLLMGESKPLPENEYIKFVDNFITKQDAFSTTRAKLNIAFVATGYPQPSIPNQLTITIKIDENSQRRTLIFDAPEDSISIGRALIHSITYDPPSTKPTVATLTIGYQSEEGGWEKNNFINLNVKL